jgi:hypothetical protein
MKKLLICCLLLTGCYTQVLNPNRIKRLPEPEPEIILPMPRYDDAVPVPQLRRDYYGRYSHPNYYNSYYPYDVPGYYQPPVRIIYANTRNNTQAQPYTVVEVKQPVAKVSQAAPPVDKERAAKIWQKRVSPRSRKPPTLTKKSTEP